MDSQPTPNKAFYTIFPKNGTDISKTDEYIKKIFGTDDIQPWTNMQQQLISWTIEASTSEVGQLQGYSDIESVVLCNPPAAPAGSNIFTSSKATVRNLDQDKQLSKRDAVGNEVVGYVIYPRDGKDKATTDRTDQNLQQLLGQDYEGPGQIFRGALRSWSVGLISEAQLAQISKDPGVRLIKEDIALELGTITDTLHQSKRDVPPDEFVGYIVYPRDGKNKTATDQTNKNLQQWLGPNYQGPGEMVDGALDCWTVGKITNAQHDQVTEDPGVLLAEENTALELDLSSDILHLRDCSP